MNENDTHKSIYLLPNLITTAGLLASFYGILSAINENYTMACVYVFIAMFFDGIDGRVARWTNTTSEFGEQYDSLADMMSFGVAPALIMYVWSIHHASNVSWLPSRISWMVPFIYIACAAMRLARFNTQTASADPRFFSGLSSPMAAGLVVGWLWFALEFDWEGRDTSLFSLLVTFTAGILMILPVPYHSFKKLNIAGKVPLLIMGLVAVIIALLTLNPPMTVWLIFVIYAVHGPILFIWTYFKH